MSKTLVIIDMQKGTLVDKEFSQEWFSRYKKAVKEIKNLIPRFDSVIFLMFTGKKGKKPYKEIKPEYLELVDELQGVTDEAQVIYKDGDDGSVEVMSVLDKGGEVYVCGMNTDACVSDTTLGLTQKGFNVSVVGAACWSMHESERRGVHKTALEVLQNNNVQVI